MQRIADQVAAGCFQRGRGEKLRIAWQERRERREGLDARRLAILARRLRRAEAAIEMAVGVAATALSGQPWSERGPIVFDAERFYRLPAEVALRLLARAIAFVGDEGPVELGKVEALFDALAAVSAFRQTARLRRTLAGALVALAAGRLTVARAPARRAGIQRLTTAPRARRSPAKLR